MHVWCDRCFKGKLVFLSLYIYYNIFHYLSMLCYVILYVELQWYTMQQREEQWWEVTLRPSALQSEMGHPWSRVEKGHAPLLMCLYHWDRFPGQSSLTCAMTLAHPYTVLCCAMMSRAMLCHAVPTRILF